MQLLIKMMYRRILPVVLSISASIFATLVTLWWNRQLSSVINEINAGARVPADAIITAAAAMLASRAISEAAQQSQQANGRLNGFAESLVAVFPVMKLFDAVRLVRSKYDTALEEWEQAAVRQDRRRAALMSPSGLMSCIPLLLLFAVGGMQVVRGELSTGSLYVFINLSGNVSGLMMNMPGRIASFRRFAVNLERIGPYMAAGFAAGKTGGGSGVSAGV